MISEQTTAELEREPEPPPPSEPDFDPYDPEYPSYEWRRELLSDD